MWVGKYNRQMAQMLNRHLCNGFSPHVGKAVGSDACRAHSAQVQNK